MFCLSAEGHTPFLSGVRISAHRNRIHQQQPWGILEDENLLLEEVCPICLRVDSHLARCGVRASPAPPVPTPPPATVPSFLGLGGRDGGPPSVEAVVGRWAEGGSLHWAVSCLHGRVTSVPTEALAQHSLVLSPVPHFMCSAFVPPDPVLCGPRVAPACRAWKIREEHCSSQGRGEEC